MKVKPNATNRQDGKQQQPTAPAEEGETRRQGEAETATPAATLETSSSGSSGTVVEEEIPRQETALPTTPMSSSAPVVLETPSAPKKTEVAPVRNIVVPVMAELTASGMSAAAARATVLAQCAVAAVLAANPETSDEDLQRVRDRIVDLESFEMMEGDRRAIFPVPTIGEVLKMGYDAKYAPDIVIGALSRYALRVTVPSVAAVIALGFEEQRAATIVEDIVAEKRFEEIWGCDDIEVLMERLRALASEPVHQQLEECVSDNSDGLKVLGLMGRMMDMVLDFTGHVANPQVQAWRGEVGQLKDKLDLERGEWERAGARPSED